MKPTRLCLVAAPLFVLATSLAAHAQSTPLSLGTWNTPQQTSCQSNFYGSNCYMTTITCPHAAPLTATFGYKIPTTNPAGTIVIFTGGGGTANFEDDLDYASYYFNPPYNYAVVQIDWSADWENTNSGLTDPTYPFSIQAAACRAATFLELVYSGTISGLYTTGTAFCAQGKSGGSGALGYSLAWYGAGSFTTGYPHLDNAELIDGPMFSDLEQGCEQFYSGGVCSSAPNVTVCPTGQLGCTGWPTGGVPVSPTYLYGSETTVGYWTGDSSCGVCPPATSNTSNQNWLNQSNVTTGASFSYSKTSMAGWLCASVVNQVGQDQCHQYPQRCLNNTTSQGQIFFANFTNSNQVVTLTVNAVNNCQGSEGVENGTVQGGLSGMVAIENDMTGNCKIHQ